ncbi:hypothetical protein MTBPR1_20147 [Candidatus Terasakiella magnetica]|uniref:Methyltransferase domain-containing protein n=1 Tax=Candidatus Terasakiella magnetica TaxID=1867952 RepID=A0A1C3RGB5_9PROT|nr:class I SAM-dependent methyltransferase [Candidatus Terasakiella magnetica]SCA56299.1 hypothetical protein MTBPR1_20147 [Candidatus Terasakiella magnetica]
MSQDYSKLVSFLGIILKIIPLSLFEKLIKALLYGRLRANPSTEGLKTALKLDNTLYGICGQLAVSYDNGNHAKQRLTGYIDNFAHLATKMDGPYLDIGCGSGVLSHAIAQKTQQTVTGIDIIESKVKSASKRYKQNNLDFIVGDATQMALNQQYQTIILSNVLEHISERVSFLKALNNYHNPEQFLIRVPIFERDWRVPLKKELNIDWRLDSTHETEHTIREFKEEITKSGLRIHRSEVKWGEIWAVVKPKNES